MSVVDDLREEFPHLGRHILESPKIWHRKYPCKIKLSTAVSREEAWYWLGAFCGLPIPVTHERFRFRSGTQITIYFENVDDGKEAIRYFNPRIVNCHFPIDEESTRILGNDKKIRLKKQLYFKKYSHKIRFGYRHFLPEDKREEIKAWVKDMFDVRSDDYMKNERVWFRHRQQEPTMFLRDEDDVTLVKLAWGEHFDEIETIKLISDTE